MNFMTERHLKPAVMGERKPQSQGWVELGKSHASMVLVLSYLIASISLSLRL